MERVCFTFELYEGAEDEYKRRHDEIWPDLVADIKAAGFSNYSLFRRGSQIVAYAEVSPDLETAMGALASSEANGRWAAWFEDLIVNLTDSQGRLMSMQEVWHLD